MELQTPVEERKVDTHSIGIKSWAEKKIRREKKTDWREDSETSKFCWVLKGEVWASSRRQKKRGNIVADQQFFQA